MAHQLITEEVEGDPIRVPPRELAPQLADIEVLGIVQVVRRYRQVKGVPTFPHVRPPSNVHKVSARSPSRIVSKPNTAVAATFPRFTFGPRRFTK